MLEIKEDLEEKKSKQICYNLFLIQVFIYTVYRGAEPKRKRKFEIYTKYRL